ncbi:hypothetical protein Ndes2526B_g02554 [Nannochloris sp. 'desiccata']|nr:hypothetical protein KSW81_007147 [Chlorella desiccata (nom. nud.)]KAH7621737.1 putative High mobility group B protein 9 [Chlorella desiccata (nom. nud.)]
MSAAPDQDNSGELEAARKAVAAALLDANVNVLFGSPVDTSALTDYLTIIDTPKDLGTVLADLEGSLEGSGPYKTAADVFKDVSLVWSNCLKYNDRPEDKAIVDICKRSAKLFEKEWRKAGLKVCKDQASHVNTGVRLAGDSSSSKAVDEKEFEPLPLRLLTNFEIMSAADPTALRSLDTLNQERTTGGSLLITGSLIPVGADVKKESGEPLSPPERLVDWIVEYLDTEVTIWAATDTAWYKLLHPTDRYEPMYTSAMQGVALAREVLEELAAGEDAGDISALVERVAGNIASPDPSRRRGTVTKEAKDLAIAHVETKIGRRKPRSRRKRRGSGLTTVSGIKRPRGGGSMGRITSRSRLGPGGDALPEDFASGFFIGDEIDAISDNDMPVDFQISDNEDDNTATVNGYEGPGNARQRAWKRVKYWNRRSEEEKRQRIAEEALSNQENKADAGRGEPPMPVCSSRLPLKCLPNILMVWDFAQSFRDVLQLPPFSLTALEAALDPGPRVRKNQSYWMKDGQEEEEESSTSEEEEDQMLDEKLDVVKQGENAKSGKEVHANGIRKKEVIKGKVKEDTPMEEAPVAAAAPSTTAELKVEGSPGPVDDSSPGPEGGPKHLPWQRKGVKIAPQNIVEDPTVKTRRQKGVVPAPSSKALDMQAEIDTDGNEFSAAGSGPSPSTSKIKLKLGGGSSSSGKVGGDLGVHADNPVAAALSAAQAAQDAYKKMIKSKYGVNPDSIATMPVLDRDSGSAGLLLRDLVVSLASAAAGLLPGAVAAAGGQPPLKSAKMTNPDAEHPSWPERLANTVWGAPTSSPEARQAALKLAYGDYIDLFPEERLSLLVALTDAALSSEAMIAEISLRVDQFGVNTTRRDGGAGDELDDENGRLAYAAAHAVVVVPPLSAVPTAPAAGEENAAEAADMPSSSVSPLHLWQKWHAAQNLGIRRPLGIDYRGRRYWAMGRESAAFKIFCQEPSTESEGEETEGRWGWYEGQSIQDLVTWLSSASIRCEAALITALRAAPQPFSTPTPSAPARHLIDGELATQRADGYRGLILPLLRGEWNNRREGTANTPPTNEQRIPLAVDVMLGAVPLWFKGEVVQRHAMAISDVLASAQYGRDAARALLETERLLAAEGHVTQEWIDIWQAQWRRVVAGMTDLKDVPLCTAALQTHVKTAPDIIPRPAFMKIATESNFVLTIPALGDTVIVLRAGLLHHLDRYMQIVGAAEPPAVPVQHTSVRDVGGEEEEQHGKGVKNEGGPEAGAPAGAVSGLSTGKPDEDDPELDNDAENENGAPAVNVISAPSATRGKLSLLPAPKIKESSLPRVIQEWEALRTRVAALRPAERYTVRSIVYRRHLADDADVVKDEDSNTALRAPVAWVFLRPARYGPKHQLPTGDIVLPVAIVSGLPDYLLKVEAYVSGMRVFWQPGDRFRMFFGGKISEKTLRKVKAGGTWHKGEVVAVEANAPGRYASLEEKEKYDPWESIVVRWDHLAQDYVDRVNPWELEIDPEEETRRGDEARRLQQAAARSQRARASSRRAPDDPLAAQQAAEWDAEDANLEVLAAQAERANLLLSIHKAKPEPEDTVFNDAAYGPMALQTQQILLATLGAPALMAHAAAAAAAAAAATATATAQNKIGSSGGGGSSKGPAAGLAAAAVGIGGGGGGGGSGGGTRSSGAPIAPNPPTSNVPTGPLKPGQEVPPKVLEALRLLDSAQLTTLLVNFYRGLKGKFKIPIFAHKELDLHAVWWAVMERGGYETVTASKQWRDICRALPQLDLSGQTSASYNMRLNYERCLLDFENYLASGQYEADVKAGTAPVHTHLTDAVGTRFTIPGAYPAAVDKRVGGAGGSLINEPAAAGPLSAGVLAAHQAADTQSAPPSLQHSLGSRLREAGTDAIGRVVQRYWPAEGGWWDATVTDYNAETKEHQLTYNVGRPDESFEFVNLAQVNDREFRLKSENEEGDTGAANLKREGAEAAVAAVKELEGDAEEPMAPAGGKVAEADVDCMDLDHLNFIE